MTALLPLARRVTAAELLARRLAAPEPLTPD